MNLLKPCVMSVLCLLFTTPLFAQNGKVAPKIGYKVSIMNESKQPFPILTEYGDKKILQTINNQIKEITKGMHCDPTTPKNKSYFDVKSKVEYAKNDVFSLYVLESYFCNGAYPNEDVNVSMTFDLKTGKQISFADLFKNYEENKKSILGTIFSVEIEAARQIPENDNPTSCDDDPRLYSMDHLMDSYFEYNFTEQGLAVQPAWPHVIQGCANRVIVPYSKLKAFASQDGILARAE